MSLTELNNLITESKLVFAEFKAWKNIIVPINKAERVTLSAGSDYIKLLFSRDGNPFVFYGKLYGFDNLFNTLSTTKSQITVNLATLKELSTVLKKNAVSVNFTGTEVTYKYKNKDDENEVLEKTLKLEALNDQYIPDFEVLKETKIDEHLLDNELLKVFLDDSNELTGDRTHKKLFEFPVAKIWSILDISNTFVSFSEEHNGRRFVDIYSKKDNLELHQLFLTI